MNSLEELIALFEKQADTYKTLAWQLDNPYLTAEHKGMGNAYENAAQNLKDTMANMEVANAGELNCLFPA